MTRVTLLTQGGSIRGFECTGHAGFADAGADIVCAAISVLTTTCANALESVAGIAPVVDVSDGSMRVMLPPDEDGRDAQVILRTMKQGLTDIAQQYPRHLRLAEN